jgi:NNP family nitrate/nitrite transporter-like MFS transporter
MLTIPKMEIFSAGNGLMSTKNGIVEAISPSAITIDGFKYSIIEKPLSFKNDKDFLAFPDKKTWQEPIVKVGQKVQKKELLASGKTRIYFQANLWIYVVLVVLIGSIWGIGKAAVYKHIADYYPNEIGLVGGIVGVMGGLGGFFSPIIFGYLLDGTGFWTSCWLFIFLYSLSCYIIMNKAIDKMNQQNNK